MSRDPHAHKHAPADLPILDLLRRRFSPYGFADDPVAEEDLRALLEAARWAPSSYNEQPWRFVVARRHQEPDVFRRFVACLVEANRTWAARAPVLIAVLAHSRFTANGRENPHAWHDVGLATAQLLLEATARGLHVHPMAGVDRDALAEVVAAPADHAVVTALAVGRAGRPDGLPREIAERDETPRSRRPLGEIAQRGRFGVPWS